MLVDVVGVLVEKVLYLYRPVLALAAGNHHCHRPVPSSLHQFVELCKHTVPDACKGSLGHVERVLEIGVVSTAVEVVCSRGLAVLRVHKASDVQDNRVLDSNLLKEVGEVGVERVLHHCQVVSALVAFLWSGVGAWSDEPKMWRAVAGEELGLKYCVVVVL